MQMKPSGKAMLVVGAIAATTAVGYAQMRTYTTTDLQSTKSGQAFLKALTDLETVYYKPVDRDKLLQGAVKGMVNSLEDEFVFYFEPENAQSQAEQLQGEFFGIGVVIRSANSDGTGAQIEGVYKGQPAAVAGVQAGDTVVKIGGEDVSKLTLMQIVRKIRGPKGTNVEIEFARGNTTYTTQISRAPITLVEVETAMLPGNVGYVALNSFLNVKVFEQFDKAITDLQKQGVDKLVLDLRDNTGGLVDAGLYVADKFMDKGPIMSVRGRDGKQIVFGSAKASKSDWKGEMVVLINRNSASASEIVSGALQDTKRATVIGEKSFGKGVMQTVTQLPDGTQINIVTHDWLTPKGRSIHKTGIEPDVILVDSRLPKLLTLNGGGLTAGDKVTVKIGERTLNLTADKEGNLSFTDTPARPPVSTEQGKAIVDLKTDAQLARALEILAK